MSAKHALLGLLTDRPNYPYQLANQLETRLGPGWAINPGQVSQTMRDLQNEGLIELVANDRRDGRATRRVFAITDRGTQEFERWWLEQETPEARLPRRPLLIKIALGGTTRLRDGLQEISAYEALYVERVKQLAHREHELLSKDPEVRIDNLGIRLGLKGALRTLEAELEWARDARELVLLLLERQERQPAAAAPRRASADAGGDRRHVVRSDLFGRLASRHLQPTPDREAP